MKNIKRTVETITYSPLHRALLDILVDGKAVFLDDDLIDKIYKEAIKRKPHNARRSISAMIRSASKKLNDIYANIERKTGLGRGVSAKYQLVGDIKGVKQSLKNHAARIKERENGKK